MKKTILAFLAILLCCSQVQAQNVEGQIIASQFGQFEVPTVGNGFSFPPATCQVNGGGKNFPAFTANVPIKVVDANPAQIEVDTPVAVNVNNNNCSVSMTTTYNHVSFYLTSGTGGLQEAINNGPIRSGGPNTIILNADWYAQVAPSNPATVIAAVHGNTNLSLVDVTTAPYTNYTWNGSRYVSAPDPAAGIPATNLVLKGSGTSGVAVAASPDVDYLTPNAVGTISVKDYGAVCNWNGTTGTDDSTAFQSASTAASTSYASTGTPVTIVVPYGCTLGTGAGQTTINAASGVHWKGPGSIYVPAQSANALFLSQSASDISYDGLTITMVTNLTACGPTQNNALCAAIRWDGASAGAGTAYKRVSVTNNTIINSGWGIAIIAQAGLDTLSNVHVDGNTIMESQAPIVSYQYADGIHVGGAVSGVTINHNIVTGRGDAGIAVTSEVSSALRRCSDVAITGNTLYEDRIGIDDSGCSSLTVSGNQVHADIPTSTSNPAFRSIYYNALPTNVNIMGNNFENYQGSGTDVSAKYDCEGGCATAYNSKFTGNKIFSFYLRGSQVDVSSNTFEAGGTFDLDWDTTNGIGSTSDTIGQNSWQGTGTFSNDSRSDIYANDYLAPQISAGTITFTHPGEISPIAATFSSIVDTGLTAGTSPVCPNGSGGALTTSGCTGTGGSGVSSLNSLTGGVNITAGSNVTVTPSGSSIQISSSGGGGGVSNANFMFVGDSITCGNASSSGCANLGPGAGTPVVTNSTGYSANTTGTASSSSTTLTVASATGIINGELVVGAGIQPGTLETISGTTVTLSLPTTAPLASTPVSFGLMDYPAQAMRRAGLTGNSNTGINAGVSGWRSDQIISAYTSIVHPYAPSVTGKPGYLFVQIGTNDIFQSIPPATTAANLTSYWQTAKADGWTVIALTIPIGPWNGSQYGWWISLNSYIRANGTQYDRLVDETQVLNNDYDLNLFNSDNIHPINPGYTILAQLAAAAISTNESVRPSPIVLPLGASNCLSNPSCFAANYFPSVQNGSTITTGFYNAAAGFQSMKFATTDYQDTAFGAGALPNVNGSHGNSGFGHFIFQNLSNGGNNSALGDSACPTVTTGSYNNCFGVGSDVSIGGSVGRTQLGNGTNSFDNTLQFDTWNLLDNVGNLAANTLKETVGSPIASNSTISPLSGVTHITGTTAINTITVPTILENGAAFTGCIKLIPDGLWSTTTSGNISLASSAVVGQELTECYDGTKWNPSYTSSGLPVAPGYGYVPVSTGAGSVYSAQGAILQFGANNTQFVVGPNSSNLWTTLAPSSMNKVFLVEGFNNSGTYSGVGTAATAWASGPDYGFCQVVSNGGTDWIAVQHPGSGSTTPGTNVNVWLPYPNFQAASNVDCAWYMGQAYKHSNHASISLWLGSATYSTGGLVDLVDGNSFDDEFAEGLQGVGMSGSILSYTGSAAVPVLSRQNGGGNFASQNFHDFTIDGGGTASADLELDTLNQSAVYNLSVGHVEPGADHDIQISHSGGFGFQVALHDINIGIFPDNSGGTANCGVFTANVVGGSITSYTVNTPGTCYHAASASNVYHVQVRGYDSSNTATLPCTVMPIGQAVTLSGTGVSAISEGSNTGGSGCSGTIYVQVYSSQPVNYGLVMNGSDSHIEDITSYVGDIAAFNLEAGNVTATHLHPSVVPNGVESNVSGALMGTEIDDVYDKGFIFNQPFSTTAMSVTGTNGYIGCNGSTRLEVGSSMYYFASASNNVNIGDSASLQDDGGATSGCNTGWQEFVTQSGPIQSPSDFATKAPSGFSETGNDKSLTLTKTIGDYIPTLTVSSCTGCLSGTLPTTLTLPATNTATSGSNFNSYTFKQQFSVWTGSAAFTGDWQVTATTASGTNPVGTLNYQYDPPTGVSATPQVNYGSTTELLAASAAYNSFVTSQQLRMGGTTFSVSGCGTSTSLVGGSAGGKFVGGSATCTPVITMGGATAPNGWTCHMNDRTTATAAFRETADSQTTATFTAGGTVGATDTIDFGCLAY